jgi:putative ABC transport system ATP-binding protein
MYTNFDSLAVRCENVIKDFPAGDRMARVLRGVDLDIYPGELTMLVGPSGCGKTTLLSIIAGILTPTGGAVTILGQNVTGLSDSEKVRFRRANIGFIFQQYNLLPALTATENVSVPLVASGVDSRQAETRAAEVLEQVGLREHIQKLPSQLSGGQQQRVAIARALVHDPKIVVCDEPTAALDAHAGQTVMQLLRKSAVQAGRAAIVVTHDNRILQYADRIAEMSDGRIEQVSTPGLAAAPAA